MNIFNYVANLVRTMLLHIRPVVQAVCPDLPDNATHAAVNQLPDCLNRIPHNDCGMRMTDRPSSAPLATRGLDGALRTKKRLLALLLAIILIPGPLSANVNADWAEDNEDAQSTKVLPLGSSAFGEHIDLYDGSLSFSVADISITGNNLMPVELKRRYNILLRNEDGGASTDGTFSDWELDTPRISGAFATTWHDDRCSGSLAPPNIEVHFRDVSYAKFWKGNDAHMPFGGAFLKPSQAETKPISGASFVAVTKGRAWFYCDPAVNVKNSTGEGFVAITPDGTRYWFDWLAQYGESTVYVRHQNHADPVSRSRNVLYATRVEDRFGNWVTYSYSNNPAARAKLDSIQSSDGRQILLTYDAEGRIKAASAGARTWSYSYSAAPLYGRSYLTSVGLPDGTSWTIDFSKLFLMEGVDSEGFGRSCLHPGYITKSEYVGSIVHPSGATMEYVVTQMLHGRTNVPYSCNTNNTSGVHSDDISRHLRAYWVPSLVSKRVYGPGLADMQWSYSYAASRNDEGVPGSWAASSGDDPVCLSDNCAGTTSTTVNGPGGDWMRYTFGTSYRYNEQKLIKVETGAGPNNINRTESYGYTILDSSGKFLPPIGTSIPSARGRSPEFIEAYPRPERIRTVFQNGVTFTSTVQSFGAFWRPIVVTKSSTIVGSPSKTEVTAYHDNLSNWVLGQPAKLTVNGIVASEITYSSHALPLTFKSFGKLQETRTYDVTTAGQRGMIKTIKDGNGNITTLTNWKRGIPQSIAYADGTSQSAVVNDAGWITRVTDENGFATNYAYDPMGRLSRITYPTGDSTAWNSTSFVFEKRAGSAYGLPAGHWRQVVSTGNGRKLTYFDALWRPVLVQEYDAGNAAATNRFTRYAYDHEGRTTFTSYPVSSVSSLSAVTQGTHSSYDAIGRTTTVRQNSELGDLVTFHSYHNNADGYYTRITDPKGNQTRIWYQAFDQPSEGFPTIITDPGGRTDIIRDVFGKPKSITRSGGGVSATRSYLYNANQLLCKAVDPETRATIFAYDGAGNLAWSKTGSGYTNVSNCNTDSVPMADRTVRTYDKRNRLKTLSFPDRRGDQTWRYTPDGLPAGVTAANGLAGEVLVTSTYVYNRRRLLVHEDMSRAGMTPWNISYAYNANGHLSSLKYPSGLTVAYAPNALGQPTQAGAYATGVTYHTNGAIARFTYGNGLVHTTTQNLRGLPERIQDAGAVRGVDESYDYDANGNVLAISDGLPGARRNVDMAYDGLDRLTRATSSMFGGSGTPTHAYYGYDVLDNLTWVKNLSVGNARNHYYCYDAKWQLTSVRTGSCSGTTVMNIGYDAQGNLADRNGQRYTFDSGNRLREAVGKETYWYDGYGRRVQANSLTGQGGIVSHYSKSGQLLYQQDYRAAKRYEYVYLGGRSVAYEETSSGSAGVRRYQHTDALGSVAALTSATPTVVRRMEYEPYGRRIGAVNDDRPGYTGHVMDAATGLMYMQQRYYDPAIGRFLSVDPVGVSTSSGANFNRYWYANNNPYSFIDPDGRQSKFREVIKGMAEGLADSALADAHYSSPNPMVAAYPGESSQAEACGCNYQSPFGAATSNEQQLGRDLSPAAGILLGVVTRNPAGASRVVEGGGARLGSLGASEIRRIQNAANRSGQEINLVGSRASGTSTSDSDWDYVINANSSTRNSLSRSLPGAGNLSEGSRPNIDIFKGSVDESKPFIRFSPEDDL
ncbi:RHS repeat domain-containing protein [Luteimonas sp. R10]|uniref:RHS repeat domain-containing protein n=1 Tax=Luteimonas sp. R10 TaxID=3108176 RepID=UPI00308F06AD|nr:RHS repeat-associated core domain-containing protein [Luteimonas sp. R10]